ncbi:BON domain-containing protein [Maribacter algicola]|uniref:BON domain-containing protein n=1 Tax=Maribacter algicola TaxID=2498892 RepID=A0A426RNN7_9FLAO|nr:BON domain-containing protein [Maribacter algicola]RRQ50590.1 BON domain-containing protein [Maribacter algicola]
MVFAEDVYIHLSGQVSWDYQRKLAQLILQDPLGIRIEIVPKTNANIIESQITKAYERLAGLEAKGIRVQVDGDTVQLKGRVHSFKERELADKTAYKALGVRYVQHDIVVQYYAEFF